MLGFNNKTPRALSGDTHKHDLNNVILRFLRFLTFASLFIQLTDPHFQYLKIEGKSL